MHACIITYSISIIAIIQPKGKQTITVTYSPLQAKVLIATAVFKFYDGEESSRVLKMSAVGKYPFLTISSEKLDFETLIVGKITKKELLLKNESLVPA